MTEAYPTRRALRELNWRPRRFWVLRWVLVGVGAALLFLIGWVGVRGAIAAVQLQSVMPAVSQVKDDLKKLDLDAAQGTVGDIAEKTASARALTSDPVWRIWELMPGLGPNFTGVRELAAIADDIVASIMVPVAGLGDELDLDALKPVDGRIDISSFERATPVVAQAQVDLERIYADVVDLDTSGALGPVRDAHDELEGMLAPLLPVMDQGTAFLELLPGLLGADGPRSYLVVFQNNAEARALGGHSGSWLDVGIDDGKITLGTQTSVHALKTGGVPVLALPADQLVVWPGAGVDPANSTMVPRLDQAAATAAAFWNNRFPTQPQVVVFVDPVALGYLLAATGPIELPSGDVIDTKTAADFLLNGVYLTYSDPAEQDVVFNSLAKSMFEAILSGNFNPAEAAKAALKAAAEHRLLLWSFLEDEQDAFAKLPFTLDTPQSDETHTEFGVYITDNLGSKMTYYIDGTVELGQAQCAAGDYEYAVKVSLHNRVTAEEGALLPNYVSNRSGGSLRVYVTLYAPPGSEIVREAAAGWDPTFVTLNGTDGEYPVMTQRVILDPQQTVVGTYIIRTDAPMSPTELSAYVTPLARPIPVTEFDYSC